MKGVGVITEDWMPVYNEEPSISTLGGLAPNQFAHDVPQDVTQDVTYQIASDLTLGQCLATILNVILDI